MNRLQKITLALGCTGIVCSISSIGLNNTRLGYIGSMLGRASGFTYMLVLDKYRPYYLAPLVIGLINIFTVNQYMLFSEMAISSMIYQIGAYNTFKKMGKDE